MRVRHAFDARRQCNPCCRGSHARSEKRVGRSETGTRPELDRNDVAGFEDRKIRTKTAKMGRICRYLAEQILIRHDPCE
jgi:hypothetical protein